MMLWVKLSFRQDEGGTDAILVAASDKKSEGDFSSSSNATSLEFMTGVQLQKYDECDLMLTRSLRFSKHMEKRIYR